MKKLLLSFSLCVFMVVGGAFLLSGCFGGGGYNPRNVGNFHAQAPLITAQPIPRNVAQNTIIVLAVSASSIDGGVLSFQWFRNNHPVQGAIGSTFQPDTSNVGFTSYFVAVTNTNTTVGGVQTVTIHSDVVTVTVTAPQAVTISVVGGTVRLVGSEANTAVASGEFLTGQQVIIRPDDWAPAQNSVGGDFLYFSNTTTNSVFAWRHEFMEQIFSGDFPTWRERTFTHTVTGNLNLRAVRHENVIGLGVVAQLAWQPNSRIEHFNRAPIDMRDGMERGGMHLSHLLNPTHTARLSHGVMNTGFYTWDSGQPYFNRMWTYTNMPTLVPSFPEDEIFTVNFELNGGNVDRFRLYLIVFVPELNRNMAFITHSGHGALIGWTIPGPQVIQSGVFSYSFTNARGQTFVLNSRARG